MGLAATRVFLVGVGPKMVSLVGFVSTRVLLVDVGPISVFLVGLEPIRVALAGVAPVACSSAKRWTRNRVVRVALESKACFLWALSPQGCFPLGISSTLSLPLTFRSEIVLGLSSVLALWWSSRSENVLGFASTLTWWGGQSDATLFLDSLSL